MEFSQHSHQKARLMFRLEAVLIPVLGTVDLEFREVSGNNTEVDPASVSWFS